MDRMLFVNLPVADVARSRAFFTELGFDFNEEYSDERAVCLVLSTSAFVMLLSRDFFAGFTPRPVADATSVTEALLAVSSESREAVDRFVATAVAAGGEEVRNPMDEGGMYVRSVSDPDGHIWEVMSIAPDPEGARPR
jgi:hypothetical protein